jgi:ABC-2 type transport system ATP-binding protein
LSGGQKQRVLFALAICGNPDLLILDEPTVGLDVEARRAMWTQIRSFVAKGKSILLTTHYLEEADALADRIVVIDRGRIIAEGSPAEIKTRASGKRIRVRTRLTLDEVRELPLVASATNGGGRIEITTTSSDDVSRALLARDASLADIEITSAGLEDAFLAMTSGAQQ